MAKTVRLKVSPRVAQIVANEAPRELKLKAARGNLSVPAKDQITLLFFLGHGADTEIREEAAETLRALPASQVLPAVRDPELHPHLIDYLARLKLEDAEVMAHLMGHPAISPATLIRVAATGGNAVVAPLAREKGRLQSFPEVAQALLANPRIDSALKRQVEKSLESPSAVADGSGDEVSEEEQNLTKYQQALEMDVSKKIKMAMTGDKEWRAILIKEPNKLVCSAVLKNPRITEGEVLAVAANRSSSEELIRQITLNPDWLKNQQIKKALIQHPRTPLPKALRYMDVLTEKELKIIAKSRNVSRVIVNQARRILIAREKKSKG